MIEDVRSIDVLSLRNRTPLRMQYREGTTDLSTVSSAMWMWGAVDDAYGLRDQYPSTYLDLGAHIGAIVVAVLVDNPACRAVAIEPLPENLALLRHNIAENGVADRVTVIEGAIGLDATQRVAYRTPPEPDDGWVHRYVGTPVLDSYDGWSVVTPTHTLSDLVDMLGDSIDLAKIDCEGCEWVALTDPAVARARQWLGEWHSPGGDAATIEALLSATHDVTVSTNPNGLDGPFRAVRR
jgi:FkbM family methyltransferase